MSRKDAEKGLIATLVAMFAVLTTAPATATVTIEHVIPGYDFSMEGGVPFGSSFDVDVRLHWDGEGEALFGIFTSTRFENVEFVGSTSGPAIILYTLDPETGDVLSGLNRVSLQPRPLPGDPANVLRTVQYGSVLPPDPSAATWGEGILIRRLTFRYLGIPPAIEGFLADGDGLLVANGVVLSDVVFVTTFVPEPGTAWLLGLGLLALARWAAFGRDAVSTRREPA